MNDDVLERQLRAWFDAHAEPEVPGSLARFLSELPATREHTNRVVRSAPIQIRARRGDWAVILVEAIVTIAIGVGLVAGGIVIFPKPLVSPVPSAVRTSPAPSHATTPAPSRDAPIDTAGVTPSGAIWTIRTNVLAISPDLGATWHRATMPPPESPDESSPTFVLDDRHAWAITVTPDSSESGQGPEFDHVHLIVNRTSDGGDTWEPSIVSGDFPDTARSIVFADVQDGYLMISGARTNQGSSTMLRTSDGGLSWSVAATVRAGDLGSIGSVIALSSPSTVWAAAQEEAGPVNHPVLAVSRDRGATWAPAVLPGIQMQEGGTANDPLGPPRFFEANVGLFALTSFDQATTGDPSGNPQPYVYRTEDGGRHWTRQGTLAFWVDGSMAFLTETRWVAALAGEPSTLEITDDAGSTWRAVHPSGVPDGSFLQLAVVGDRQLLGLDLVGGNSGNPVVAALSSDGGVTWQAIHP